MSSRLKFSMGWCTLFAILHAAGTLYVCVATALFSPENHIAWYWNPLAMKFHYSSGNILFPVILGLPVSVLIGIFFGYLIPVFHSKRSVQDLRAMRADTNHKNSTGLLAMLACLIVMILNSLIFGVSRGNSGEISEAGLFVNVPATLIAWFAFVRGSRNQADSIAAILLFTPIHFIVISNLCSTWLWLHRSL